ncbi:GTP cyclohydrolase [Bdellovibrio svalbardensis]|uniref:GTP cyclohydrolase n=1 Tax=Bdellovibrio svalbardensis TaxID=2972972 RepID=A0ABT6DMN5_9BACT|nr:GTP cyclohydrolase [Bdellovibrio svalbardensis]MDG0817911.1 GTP cyclohydrolase [Bdellovibrio svalbardensis]
MEKLSQALASKISHFQKRLQSFLENDFDPNSEEHERMRKEFESSRDSALVRGISQGLPEDHIDRAIVVFSRLAMVFEAGVLLENNDGEWKAQAAFSKGITELLKNPSKATIKIPSVNLMTVLKTDAYSMLQKLNLNHLDPENKTACLLIKVSPDFALLLFSDLPDLWLKEHTENVRRALINGFAD